MSPPGSPPAPVFSPRRLDVRVCPQILPGAFAVPPPLPQCVGACPPTIAPAHQCCTPRQHTHTHHIEMAFGMGERLGHKHGCVCVCVCVCVRPHLYFCRLLPSTSKLHAVFVHNLLHSSTEQHNQRQHREVERERGREREKQRERMRMSVCVCLTKE